ncbi:MAG: hypothetical protein J6P98_01945 [Clostridia bacterium]|nr:hypothetical protein [Clostridia bacterium]
MRRTFFLIAALALTLSFFVGCTGEKYPLGEGAAAVEREEYALPDGSTAYLLRINGREYLYYGRLNGTVRASDTGKVLGYVRNEQFPEDDGDRIVELTGAGDIIMTYYVKGIMEQPEFLRALDTVGRDIVIPGFVEPYEEQAWFWEGSGK